jgi:hypothetical protein
MKKFYEFLIAYKADGIEELEGLGIKTSDESNWHPGMIDLNEVESFFYARQNDQSEYTETTIQMKSGDAITIKLDYKQFRDLFIKEIAK